MKKSMSKGIALVAFLSCTTVSFGQVTENEDVRVVTEESGDKFKVETNRFWDNWFITAGGGAQIYFGDHNKQMKFKDRLSPALTAGFGKWFTPGIGVRVMYDGWKYNGVTQIKSHGTGELYDWSHSKDYTTTAPAMYKQKINYYHFHGDVLFNLNNLFGGYQAERFWTISPYVGLGYAITDDSYTAKEMTANLGIVNTFRLSSALDLSLDVRGMLVNDRFDGEEGNRHKDGGLSATIGLVYKFKQRGWNKRVNTTIYDNTESNRLRGDLNRMEAENQRLKDEMANMPTETVKEREIVAAPNYVIFPLNKTTLSKEARVSLGMFAETIKSADSSTVYLISGFADAATGSAKINEKLSKGRAEAVYKCLTEEFGVPARQLEVDYKGGVKNMFYDEPALSRAVITRVR